MITASIEPATDLFVGDLLGSGPVEFRDGATPSGLTCAVADLAFSNDHGASFSYSPSPDSDGFDGNVTTLRVNPKGIFNGASSIEMPSFFLRFRVRVR